MSDYLDLRDLAEEYAKLRDSQPLEDYDNEQRLAALEELFLDLGGPDSREAMYETTLIPKDEWGDYCQELAYDIGLVQRDSIIEGYVDWERWAEDVKQDYHEIEFDGTTYYRRS